MTTTVEQVLTRKGTQCWTVDVRATVQDAVQVLTEHGIGAVLVEELEHHKSPVALALMRAIKRAVDPQNVMNPGRVLRV